MYHACFILFPAFQMLAYVLATETMRIANRIAGEPVFSWETRTATSEAVLASNGAIVEPDRTDWGGAADPDLVVLCAGYDPLSSSTHKLRAFLARADRAGVMLGGFDTGSVVLADLGFLAGHAAVLHFQAEAGFRETWPEITVSDQIYSLDRSRLTSAGGTASGDAMLAWISDRTSAEFAQATSDAMAHGKIRRGAELQRTMRTSDPVLAAMHRMMSENLAEPLAITEIAERLGTTQKRLLSRCRRGFCETPARHYSNLRLENALGLLQTTELSITEVAVSTGFLSLAGFSRAFRNQYGISPRAFRAADRIDAKPNRAAPKE